MKIKSTHLIKVNEKWIEDSDVKLGIGCHFTQLLHHVLVCVGVKNLVRLDDEAGGNDLGVVLIKGDILSKWVGRS